MNQFTRVSLRLKFCQKTVRHKLFRLLVPRIVEHCDSWCAAHRVLTCVSTLTGLINWLLSLLFDSSSSEVFLSVQDILLTLAAIIG